jgi:four helix bundle protein
MTNDKAGEKRTRQYDLEERLIDFAVLIIETVNRIPSTKAGNHLGGQLIRSGTAPALHYGEAQGAESRKDFIHKMKGALKELRESQINLKILKKTQHLTPADEKTTQECRELVQIFTRSIETAERNLAQK